MMAILLFGVAGYRLLPVSDLPNVDDPTINLNANLPGANPDTMAAAVAQPLEKQFSNIAGLDWLASSNRFGATNITLQFSLNRNLGGAAEDVETAISQASRQSPKDMPYSRQNPGDYPVLNVALTSTVLPLSAVEYAETLVAPRISAVNDVALVQIYGQFKCSPHIQLDPDALQASRSGSTTPRTLLSPATSNLPTGTLGFPPYPRRYLVELSLHK